VRLPLEAHEAVVHPVFGLDIGRDMVPDTPHLIGQETEGEVDNGSYPFVRSEPSSQPSSRPEWQEV